MPREPEPLIREKKHRTIEKIFILSYEGNYAEPDYYEALKEQLRDKHITIYMESLRRDKKDTNSAPKHVFNKLKAVKSSYNFRQTDEFWMIIDRDRWKKLDHWAEKCVQEKNFHIALSNPCFEFWLMLHFFNIKDFDKDILVKLIENKKVGKGKKRTFVEKYLSENLPDGYNKKKIRPHRFLELENIMLAIEQAEKLSNNNILSDLGSDNYILVKKLLA